MKRGGFFFGALVLTLCLVGCKALTAKEALQSVEEVALSSQALTLASGTVEIATDFTIGEATGP